jgi:hypothetical protein
LGPTASNTVVIGVPIEMMDLIKRLDDAMRNGQKRPLDSAA